VHKNKNRDGLENALKLKIYSLFGQYRRDFRTDLNFWNAQIRALIAIVRNTGFCLVLETFDDDVAQLPYLCDMCLGCDFPT
jgi:hypothetical protein